MNIKDLTLHAIKIPFILRVSGYFSKNILHSGKKHNVGEVFDIIMTAWQKKSIS